MPRFDSRPLALSALIAASVAAASPQEQPATDHPDYPVEIAAGKALVTLYQPQLESFDGNRLTARAAVAVTPADREPVFGVVWFDARVSTDRDDRTVRLVEIDASESRFPNATAEQLAQLAGLLEREIVSWNLEVSLDDLLTQLELVEKQQQAADDLETDPPAIIVLDHAAALIQLDGDPRLEPVEDTTFMRVVNTPYFMILDTAAKRYLLADGRSWFTAPEIGGPWADEPAPPEAAVTLAEQDVLRSEEQEGSRPERMPQIIVATEPTELVFTDGKASYTPIAGTSLLFVANTESDLFMDIDSQRHFLLQSGRWYGSATLAGPWSYVAADQLPAAFADIPAGSPKADVLVSVAGTRQAEEAVHDASIPQTAAIDRETATTTVEYDGEPKFEVIEGTSMTYAVNTPSSVIKIDDRYYCCDQGVWFVSTRPDGPWIVCESVPQVVYTIPPSCPVYNVTYVYVYDATPTVVYVGYLPGYTGCYVYRGTVVYGTGYYYRGWYRRVYYPRPTTYGFSFRYNSYTGSWGVRVGWGYGGWHGGFAYRSCGGRAGWWGPRGCRYVDEINRSTSITTPRGTWNAYTRAEYDDGEINIDRGASFTPNENLYERRENVERNVEDRRADREGRRDERTGERGERAGERGERAGERGERGGERGERTGQRGDLDRAGDRSGRSNDLFADREGNVVRKAPDGSWERRTGDGWTRTDDRPGAGAGDRGGRPSTGASPTRPSTGATRSPDRTRDLNRQYDARQRGAQRTQGYRSYSGSRSRSSGRSGGGGRGRR
jgi:hypothetical protein